MGMIAHNMNAIPVLEVQQIVDLLLRGFIIGLVRGQQEFGPRALGHRSFVAAAHRAEAKDRLNRLKNRRWFPAVAHIDSTARPQSVNRVDDPWLHSLLSSVRDATDDMWKSCGPLGVDSVGICVDKSWIPCGPSGINTHGQCVDDSDTKEERPLRAAGVLINTSLNPKGKPIATSLADIFAIFCSPTGDELDFVLLQEKWLFER